MTTGRDESSRTPGCQTGREGPTYFWEAPGALDLYLPGSPPASAFGGQRLIETATRLTSWAVSQKLLPNVAGSMVIGLYIVRQGSNIVLGSITIDQQQPGPYVYVERPLSVVAMPGDLLVVSMLGAPPPGAVDASVQVSTEKA